MINTNNNIDENFNPAVLQSVYDSSFDDINNKALENNVIPPKLKKYIEIDNIAEELSEEQLIDISQSVCQGVDIDKESRSDWADTYRKTLELIREDWQTKNYPWEGAANIKYPLVLSACMHFNARTIPEIVKNDRAVSVRTMSPDTPDFSKSDKAERISAHMSYQLLGQSEHWLSDTDKLLMMLPLFGVVFRKSYFDQITGIPETAICLPEDVIIDSAATSLSKAQRVTHVLYMSNNEIIENMRAGLYLTYDLKELNYSRDETKVEGDITNFNNNDMSITAYTVNKKDEAINDIVNVVYEQERWLDLDGDMYQEPYVVTVHKASNKVLRIVARYDESCFEFSDSGKFIKINPIEYFTDYHFLPNPTGSFYSLGFGTILLPINAMSNSILNQLIDAGTLANMTSGFYGADLRINSGELNIKPGEWKKLPSIPGTDIAKSIYPLVFKEPSQTLFSLLQFILDSAKQLTAVTDIMQGQLPPANTPATTTMAMLEQSQHIYSAILSRIYESLRREFNKLYQINRKYLNEEETFPMAEKSGIIRRQDYEAPDYAIFPVADPKLSSSMQRMLQAQALLDLTRFPIINLPKVLENYLTVIKVPDPKSYLVLNAPPSPDAQIKMAQVKNIDADTKKKDVETVATLADRELKAIGLANDKAKNQSESAYYGGMVNAKKIESIKTIVDIHKEASQPIVKESIREEEEMDSVTQNQMEPTMDVNLRIMQLEKMVNDLLTNKQAQIVPEQSVQMAPDQQNQQMQIAPQQQEQQIDTNQVG